METQAELKKKIGTLDQERVKLEPAKVKIVNVTVEDTAKAKKVVFEVKHPKREETIKLSSVAYLVERSVKVAGTWFNLDKEENLQKGSAIVVFLQKIGANTIEEAIGKEADTEKDGNYLCFKAY